MTDTAQPARAPLDEVMMAMDVVDTLRHRQDIVTRELSGEAREQQLIDRLREIYRQQGIDVPDHILRQGVSALAESRFVYEPPKPSFKLTLARLYVSRGRWGRPALAVFGAVVLALIAYFAIWGPIQSSQAETARLELAERLPAQMDTLYQTIFEETKVQQAVVEAETLRARGRTLAAEGDRDGAQAIIARMTELRDTLRLEYTVRVINRPGEDSGFWTFPEINTEATNFYLVVEAVDPNGQTLTLPIENEENQLIEEVDRWGIRVSEQVYNAVAADKRDDGIVQNDEVGRKSFGFLETEYALPVLGGAVTRW